MDSDICNSSSYSIFKKKILNFITHRNDIFNISLLKGLALLNRLCVCQSLPSTECKFKHCFLDTLNSVFIRGFDIQTLNNFFLHCLSVTNGRPNFLLKVESMNPIFLEKPTLVLHQYFFVVLLVFQLNLAPTYSIHLLTTFYLQKGLNWLSLYFSFVT